MNCLSSSDCPYLYICEASLCEHKSLFPLYFWEFPPFIILLFTSTITTVAGIGGGVFFFPVLMIFYNLEPIDAIAASLTAVAGVLTSRYLMSIKERHFRRDRPIIDYDIAIVFCPSVITGTIFGVLVNRLAPNWLVLSLISVAMTICFWQTWKKANQHRETETKTQTQKKNISEIHRSRINKAHNILNNDGIALTDKENEEIELIDLNNSNARHASSFQYSSLDEDLILVESNPSTTLLESVKTLEKITAEEAQLIPKKKLGILILNLGVLLLLLIMQGTKHSPSIFGVEYCSATYWFLQFLYIPFGIAIMYYSVQLLNKEHSEKVTANYLFLKTDIKYTSEAAFRSVAIGLLTGLTSAILGVGGSLIAGPVLLGMGYPPQEATYTSTFIAVFTAIAGAVQYIMAGMVRWDYSFLCLVSGWIGLYFGMGHILKEIKKRGKGSIIVYCLAITVGISTLITIYWGLKKIQEESQEGNMLRLKKARVKKIIQTNEEIGKISHSIPFLLSKSLEMFLAELITKTTQLCKDGAKPKLTPSHLKKIIEADSKYSFLSDLVKEIPSLETEKNNKKGRKKGRKHKDSDEASEKENEDEPNELEIIKKKIKKERKPRKTKKQKEEEDIEEEEIEHIESDE